MKRSLCYQAPIFDASLNYGTKVQYIKRNRKGVILLDIKGEIIRNADTILYINNDDIGIISVYAKDVYNGKDNLILEN